MNYLDYQFHHMLLFHTRHSLPQIDSHQVNFYKTIHRSEEDDRVNLLGTFIFTEYRLTELQVVDGSRLNEKMKEIDAEKVLTGVFLCLI